MKQIFKNKMFTKKNSIIAVTLLVVMIVAVMIPFSSSAKMVDVYTKSSENEHLTLEWETVYDINSQGYLPRGEASQGGGRYNIATNSWGSWFEHCATHFMCTEAPFNAGEDSVLTVKTTLNSVENLKQFGIMMRKSLAADSEMIWANFNETLTRLDYREVKGEVCGYSSKNIKVDYSKDVHLKVVISKERGVVEFFIKEGGDINDDDGWNAIMSKAFNFLKTSSSLYVGVSAAAPGGGDNFLIATFSDFSVNLQAPEGYQIEDGEGGGDSAGGETDIPPAAELPEDLAAAGDALLYETFTDGDMFPADEKKINISNPLWTVRTGTPNVVLNEAGNDRYLFADVADEPLFIEAGDMEWTDYSVQMDVLFPETVVDAEENLVRLMVRERTAPVGGVGYYGVTLYNKFENGVYLGQYLALEYKFGAISKWTDHSNCQILSEVKLSDGMLPLNTTHTIKAEVFDNTFKVYVNDLTTPVIDYVDTNTGGVLVQDPHLMGGIGLYLDVVTVEIDNIVVRKLYDPLGGDYDNSIMGDYNQPIPEWIEEHYLD